MKSILNHSLIPIFEYILEGLHYRTALVLGILCLASIEIAVEWGGIKQLSILCASILAATAQNGGTRE